MSVDLPALSLLPVSSHHTEFSSTFSFSLHCFNQRHPLSSEFLEILTYALSGFWGHANQVIFIPNPPGHPDVLWLEGATISMHTQEVGSLESAHNVLFHPTSQGKDTIPGDAKGAPFIHGFPN